MIAIDLVKLYLQQYVYVGADIKIIMKMVGMVLGKMDGGVINQQAIHHIDALQWVCGKVDEVCANTGNLLNNLEAEDISQL